MRHYPANPIELPGENILSIVNGLPCLVGTYGHREYLLTVERGLIQNQLVVETTDPHLSVIDIVVDRIGPTPLGNAEQYRRILEEIASKSHRLNGMLDTVKPGIEVTLEYELTREKDHTLVRRTNVTMFITNRTQYLDHTQPDPVTGPILTNFIDSTVKTITDRAYGSDRLICTLLNLTVAYATLRPTVTPVPGCPTPKADMNLGQLYEGVYETDRYARCAPVVCPCPPDYGVTSEFYHFENAGRSICLHQNQINNPNAFLARTIILANPINKSFIVEGGHRLELKFSIWNSDEALVNDTSKVYRLLDQHCHHPDPYPGGCFHPDERDERQLLAMIAHESRRNDYEECDIRQLSAQYDRLEVLYTGLKLKCETEIAQLRRDIEELKHPVTPEPNPDPVDPEKPTETPPETT